MRPALAVFAPRNEVGSVCEEQRSGGMWGSSYTPSSDSKSQGLRFSQHSETRKARTARFRKGRGPTCSSLEGQERHRLRGPLLSGGT